MTTYTLTIPAGTDPATLPRLGLRAAQQLELPVEVTDDTGAVVLRVTRTASGLWATTWTGPAPEGDDEPTAPEPPPPARRDPGEVLSALRVARPAEWRKRVRAALESEREIPRAARVLGVARRTLGYWLQREPSLREGIALPKPHGRNAKPRVGKGKEEK